MAAHSSSGPSRFGKSLVEGPPNAASKGLAKRIEAISALLPPFYSSRLIGGLIETGFEFTTSDNGKTSQERYKSIMGTIKQEYDEDKMGTYFPDIPQIRKGPSLTEVNGRVGGPTRALVNPSSASSSTSDSTSTSSSSPVSPSSSTQPLSLLNTITLDALLDNAKIVRAGNTIKAQLSPSERYHRSYFQINVKDVDIPVLDMEDIVDKFIHTGFEVIWNQFLDKFIPWDEPSETWNYLIDQYSQLNLDEWQSYERGILEIAPMDKYSHVLRSSAIQRTLFRFMGNISEAQRYDDEAFEGEVGMGMKHYGQILKDCDFLPVPVEFINYVHERAMKNCSITKAEILDDPRAFSMSNVELILEGKKPVNPTESDYYVAVLCMEDPIFYRDLSHKVGRGTSIVEVTDRSREEIIAGIAVHSGHPDIADAALGYLYHRVTLRDPMARVYMNPSLFLTSTSISTRV